jgi:hypothetical protein
MKHYILYSFILLAIWPSYKIYSQENRVIYQENQEDSIIYKNNYYNIFQNDTDAKQLLYIGFKGPALIPHSRIGDHLFFLDEIAFERRIFKQFSMYAAVYNLHSPLFSQQQQDYYGASLLLKYFIPTTRDRIDKKTKTNLTGPYVAAGYRRYFKSNESDIVYGYREDLKGVAIQVGWQNRIFKHSYFNMVLNMSILDDDIRFPSRGTWLNYYFNPELKFGAVIGNRKENFQACKILNCQKDRTHLFKINILDLFRRRYSRQGVSIDYEHKLGNGSWSINGGFGIDYSHIPVFTTFMGIDKPQIHSFGFTGYIEPRYYHNLKSRMLRGISGNGFSANFIGLEVTSFNWYLLIIGNQERVGSTGNSFGFFANYGIQREIGRNLYCQLRAGIQYNHHYLPVIHYDLPILNYNGFGPGFDIKLGFAF